MWDQMGPLWVQQATTEEGITIPIEFAINDNTSTIHYDIWQILGVKCLHLD